MPQQGTRCQFSSDGEHLASAVGDRLGVRDSQNMQIVHLHTCSGPISSIEWSPDNSLVLCARLALKSSSESWIDVISVLPSDDDNAVVMRIHEPGISKCQWAPDGKAVFAWSNIHVRTSI